MDYKNRNSKELGTKSYKTQKDNRERRRVKTLKFILNTSIFFNSLRIAEFHSCTFDDKALLALFAFLDY